MVPDCRIVAMEGMAVLVMSEAVLVMGEVLIPVVMKIVVVVMMMEIIVVEYHDSPKREEPEPGPKASGLPPPPWIGLNPARAPVGIVAVIA
jgi:hypothetical protein